MSTVSSVVIPSFGQITPVPSPLRVDRVKKAEAFFEKGQYTEVLDVTHDALEGTLTKSESARAYWLAGKSHEALGELEKALSSYQVAVKLFPRNPALLIALGDLFRRVGLDDRAMPQYQAALKAEPDDEKAHAALGDILSDQGLYWLATPHFKAALERDAKDLDARLGLGRSLAGAGKLAEAEKELRAGIKDGGGVDMRVGLAEVLKRAGKLADAIEQLRLATLETKRPDVNLRYAAWLLAAGRADEAAPLFKQAVAERPDDALARYFLALIDLRAGRKPAALKGFQAAADQDQSLFLRAVAKRTLELKK